MSAVWVQRFERCATHEPARPARDANFEQDFSIECALAHGVVAIVGAIDRVVRPHADAVGTVENSFSPGFEEISLAIEHTHRMLAAIEDVNAILPVYSDRANIAELPASGQLRPTFLDPVRIRAASDCGAHKRFPVWNGGCAVRAPTFKVRGPARPARRGCCRHFFPPLHRDATLAVTNNENIRVQGNVSGEPIACADVRTRRHAGRRVGFSRRVGQSGWGRRFCLFTARRNRCCHSIGRRTATSRCDFRIVAYDLRGHGLSDKPSDRAFYQEGKRWADEMHAVITAKRLRKPVVAGWSMGGRVLRTYLTSPWR